MFDNSISVLSIAANRFKKMVTIGELVIQFLFVGYYTYLLVVNFNDVVLLSAYSALIFLGLLVLFVMIFTLDPYQKKALEFKKRVRIIVRVISWSGKLTVIGYNIYRLIKYGATETGQLLLIFTILLFFAEVVLFVISTILNNYYRLLIYALRMDYQHLIGQDDIASKPIGKLLINATGTSSKEEEVNDLFIEHEIYEVIKRYIEEENDTLIHRRKLEKVLLYYYESTIDYYQDNNKLIKLYEEIDKFACNDSEFPHLFVLKFFLINQIEKVYYGLSSQYFRFVLCGLSIYRDYKFPYVVDMVYQAIIKQLTTSKDWNKVVDEENKNEKKNIFTVFKNNDKSIQGTISGSMFPLVNNIVKKSIQEYEENIRATVSGELESIVSHTIKKKVSGSIKSSFKNIFKKKKKN